MSTAQKNKVQDLHLHFQSTTTQPYLDFYYSKMCLEFSENA